MTNVAIMGYGTVGSGTFDIINKNCDGLNVKRVLDVREFPGDPVNAVLTKNFDDILNDNSISVVAETIGGTGFVYDYTKKLLMSGKSVVTSNKEMVAAHGRELVELAAANGVQYLFEASVCAAIPIIHSLKHCLSANKITEIKGILNGTTNYILTKMLKTGADFEQTLAKAQEHGYAEKDPSADVDGHDTCRKIAILAWLAFGEYGKDISWENIPTKGIRGIEPEELRQADADGFAIKLIGHARLVDGKVECSVSPMRLEKDNPLASVDGVNNAVLVTGDAAGDVMFYGKGAGKLATGSAIVADILNIKK